MKALMEFMADAVDSYRKIKKELDFSRRVTPKQYGEYLQKKRKRGKRK